MNCYLYKQNPQTLYIVKIENFHPILTPSLKRLQRGATSTKNIIFSMYNHCLNTKLFRAIPLKKVGDGGMENPLPPSLPVHVALALCPWLPVQIPNPGNTTTVKMRISNISESLRLVFSLKCRVH